MTSVLTRDPELERALRPVLLSCVAPTMTTEPAAARRGSTVDGMHPVPAASPPIDVVDQWGMQSFPASDPPANW
jgi:hypothetical protein